MAVFAEAPFEALLPAEMAARAEQIGAKKACLDWMSTFVLAVLAGALVTLAAREAGVLTRGAAPLSGAD